MSNNIFTTDAVKILKDDAATARKEGRLEVSTMPVWDSIVATYGDGKGEMKRAAILRTVLEAAGEWKTTPQVDANKIRTPFGNVVQRFGARFDAAVRRASSPTASSTELLTGAGKKATREAV